MRTAAAVCLACAALLHAPAPAAQALSAAAQQEVSAPPPSAISEDELKQQLLGKTFYLRGGYLDNTLHFDVNGQLDGTSPHASFTLSLVEITGVHLNKHRLELEGVRYGLHFLGALPSEDQSTAFDKVRLTSKKKPLRITIDREVVEKPKKEKESRKHRDKAGAPSVPQAEAGEADAPSASSTPGAPQHKGPAVTASTEHANRALRAALDRIFSSGVDARMRAELPAYWQLYYQAVDAHADYRPADPTVLRPNQVDRKARLLTVFEPPSNEYAQANGVAGMAMYHVVVGADGKPQQVVVGRPIGFGLDENAVAAIRKATFAPALKDGKPVPELLDLLVQFRIYSRRTAVASNDGAQPQPAQATEPVLPGPYSVQRPQ